MKHTTHRNSGQAEACHAYNCSHFLQRLDFYRVKCASVLLQVNCTRLNRRRSCAVTRGVQCGTCRWRCTFMAFSRYVSTAFAPHLRTIARSCGSTRPPTLLPVRHQFGSQVFPCYRVTAAPAWLTKARCHIRASLTVCHNFR